MPVKNSNQVIEGELILANGGVFKRKPSLGTARGIRRELASVYLELRRGEIDNDGAKTCAFVLRTILEAVRVDALEERIIELEKTI